MRLCDITHALGCDIYDITPTEPEWNEGPTAIHADFDVIHTHTPGRVIAITADTLAIYHDLAPHDDYTRCAINRLTVDLVTDGDPTPLFDATHPDAINFIIDGIAAAYTHKEDTTP